MVKRTGYGQSSSRSSSKSLKTQAVKATGTLKPIKHKAVSVLRPNNTKMWRQDVPSTDSSPHQSTASISNDSRDSCLAPKQKSAPVEDADDDDEMVISSDEEAPDNADAQVEEAEAQLSE
jgi:hypothetical protein